MRHIAVIYDTVEGQTSTIASRIADMLRGRGCFVQLLPTDTPIGDQVHLDGVIVGGSVHHGRHSEDLVRFVIANRALLERCPAAFFSVSFNAGIHDEQHLNEARGYVRDLLDETGWQPAQVALFGGAVRFTQYGFFTRKVLRAITRRKGLGRRSDDGTELTDWGDVAHFTDQLLERVELIDNIYERGSEK